MPAEAGEVIASKLAGFAPDLAGLAEGTRSAGVPVPALVVQLRALVGGQAAGFVHWGATSQDIADTALVLRLRVALDRLGTRLDALCHDLAGIARAHRDTPVVARTRFQQATPTGFGLKAGGWLAPLLRHRRRLDELRPRLLAVQFGGASGDLAVLGDQGIAVMEALAAELGLAAPLIPWHNQRDGLAELAAWLALVAGSLGKMGQDVLLMAQSEVGEVREAEGGGSSTMPQKSNPVLAEALVTLSRRNAVLVAGMFQAMPHAHERDGAAWALEWPILPEMAANAGAALAHAKRLATTMTVDAARMRRNLDAGGGLVLAEAISFALAAWMPRPDAQMLVKEACAEALATGRDLVAVVQARANLPIEWARLREEVLHPASAGKFVDRLLKDAI